MDTDLTNLFDPTEDTPFVKSILANQFPWPRDPQTNEPFDPLTARWLFYLVTRCEAECQNVVKAEVREGEYLSALTVLTQKKALWEDYGSIAESKGIPSDTWRQYTSHRSTDVTVTEYTSVLLNSF